MPHHVYYAVCAWGHTSPAHAAVVRSLAANPELTISLLYHNVNQSRVEADLATYDPDLTRRITLIGFGDPDLPDAMPAMAIASIKEMGGPSFVEALGRIRVTPTKIILDQSGAMPSLPAVKERFPDVPIVLFFTSSAGRLYDRIAPLPHGGGGLEKLRDERGWDDETFAKAIVCSNGDTELSGRILQSPGRAGLYDYERELNHELPPLWMKIMVSRIGNSARECGTVLVCSSHASEGSILDAMDHIGGIKIIAAGHQLNPRAYSNSGLHDGPVKSFLDKQSTRSTVYLCYGTFFGPQPHKFEVVLDTLLDSGHPFVLTQSVQNTVPPAVVDRIALSSNAYLIDGMTDQIGILNHPATAVYMMQGGWSSFAESVLAGVPMIGWPLSWSDQAANCALIAMREEPLGWEMLQTRFAKRQARRNGGVEIVGTDEAIRAEVEELLEKALGPEGEQIRGNVRKLAAQIRSEYEGRNWEDLKKFAAE